MKIIFLDIDGVMNRIGTKNRTTTQWGGFIGMEPELVQRFNKLCKATRASVVLSSTWRMDEDWKKTMKANGLTCRFIGSTPRIPCAERGEEVDFWICGFLATGKQIERYVIIDDDSDFFPSQPLAKTDYRNGLTKELAKKIEQYLNDSNPLATLSTGTTCKN